MTMAMGPIAILEARVSLQIDSAFSLPRFEEFCVCQVKFWSSVGHVHFHKPLVENGVTHEPTTASHHSLRPALTKRAASEPPQLLNRSNGDISPQKARIVASPMNRKVTNGKPVLNGHGILRNGTPRSNTQPLVLEKKKPAKLAIRKQET